MDELDERKLALERERLALERARVHLESRFVRKNFGVIVTAAVSFVAIVVSSAQVWVARIDSKQAIEQARIQKEREIEFANMEQDRRWRLDLTDFIFRHRDSVFSADASDRERVRNVLLVAFPGEITEVLFRRLEGTVPEEEKGTWREAQKKLIELNRRVFIRYDREASSKLVRSVVDRLKEAGYFLSGASNDVHVTTGSIRYFNADDKTAALQLKQVIEVLYQERGRTLAIDVLHIEKPRADPGVIELWIPR